uniref:Uncharacterized protein n=1 Tax=Arundo donax TaxID=35708 RepID=A0A0A9F2W1_ARUDO
MRENPFNLFFPVTFQRSSISRILYEKVVFLKVCSRFQSGSSLL